MPLTWIREGFPRWDADKARLVAGAPAGVFDSRFGRLREGDVVPGEWWRVEDDGRVVGFGWLDTNWGDAEILLVTDPEARRRGVGTFVLDHLAEEAHARGLNYLTNIVRPSHPDRERVTKWLEKHGFHGTEDGRLVRPVATRRT